MPKPSAVPTWNTDGTNRTTPTGGQIATGIVFGEAANSSRMNYLLNLIGQWLTWLDAGVLTGVSFVASGVITAGGLLTALAGLAVTGAVTISTTLGVTGAATLGSLIVTAAATVGTTLGVTGLITATAGLTAGANTHVTVSGTGLFKHGSVETFLSGLLWRDGFFSSPPTGAVAQKGYMYPSGSGGGIFQAPLTLPVGARVIDLALKLTTDSQAGTRTFNFNRTDLTTNTVTLIATGTTSSISGERTITLSAINHTILTNTNYWLEFEEVASAVDAIKGVVMHHDQP